jgi:hypothetical protein
MASATRFGDVLRLLAHRDHFPDLGLALAMIGFTTAAEAAEAPADASAPVVESPDEDEHVYSEPVDGWTPSAPERGPAAPAEGPGASAEPAGDLAVEDVETYSDDWQLAGALRASPDGTGVGGGPARPRRGEARQSSRFIIAHVLAPTSSEERPLTPFAYRPVPRRRRRRGPFDQAGSLDEVAWRLAVECLSATSSHSRRQSIDIAACVDALARSEAIERLPMRERGVRRAAADTLLCDVSLSNGPVGRDVAAFVAGVQAHSRNQVDILGFSRTIEALGCGSGPIWSWRPLDMSMLGQRVVVVSSLPPSAHRRRDGWLRFAESLTATGRHFAFVNVGEATMAADRDWPGSWFTLAA